MEVLSSRRARRRFPASESAPNNQILLFLSRSYLVALPDSLYLRISKQDRKVFPFLQNTLL